MTTETENVIIESTHLGYEDHSIFVVMLHFKGEYTGQGYGGYNFKSCPEYHVLAITGILNALKLTAWEDVKGKLCRIRRSEGMISAVGHIMEDRWFSFSDLTPDARAGVRKTL